LFYFGQDIKNIAKKLNLSILSLSFSVSLSLDSVTNQGSEKTRNTESETAREKKKKKLACTFCSQWSHLLSCSSSSPLSFYSPFSLSLFWFRAILCFSENNKVCLFSYTCLIKIHHLGRVCNPLNANGSVEKFDLWWIEMGFLNLP